MEKALEEFQIWSAKPAWMTSVVMTMMTMSSMRMMDQVEDQAVFLKAQNTIEVEPTEEILLEEKVLEDLLEILAQVENPVLIVQLVQVRITLTLMAVKM